MRDMKKKASKRWELEWRIDKPAGDSMAGEARKHGNSGIG